MDLLTLTRPGQPADDDHSGSWHTDGSGYAAVYLPGPCAGR